MVNGKGVILQFLLQFSLGIRACDGVPKLVESQDEEFDLELVFFNGIEIQLPFLNIFIGSIESSEE